MAVMHSAFKSFVKHLCSFESEKLLICSMKRSCFLIALISFSIACLSWGAKGHRTIALIADKHLTEETKVALKAFLPGESIEDAATWPDEHRTDEDAMFHFVNLPAGLTREQFDVFIKETDGTLYSAFARFVGTVRHPGAPFKERQRALRFIIHLVGDAHQPMHVAHKEDKGGNAIQVRFDTGGTNLHALWDSKMIDHEGLSEAERVKEYDTATPDEILEWQKADILQWLWESYLLSEELYKQVKPGQQIPEAYYKKYMVVIRKRINQSGIRLAGVLNGIMKAMPLPVHSPSSGHQAGTVLDDEAITIKLEEVAAAVGKVVKVSGMVYGVRDIGSMLLVNVGAAYPGNPLTVALKGKAKEAITAEGLQGKVITVSGEVILYKGKPEIIVSNPSHFTVK